MICFVSRSTGRNWLLCKVEVQRWWRRGWWGRGTVWKQKQNPVSISKMFYHWLVNLTFCTLKFFENFFIYCVVTGSRGSSRDPKTDLHRFHVPGHLTVEGIRATPLRPLLKMAPRPPPASQAGPRRVEAAGAVRQMQDLIRYASHLPIQVQALWYHWPLPNNVQSLWGQEHRA